MMTNIKYLSIVFLLITTLSFTSNRFLRIEENLSSFDLVSKQKDTSKVTLFKKIISDIQKQGAKEDFGENMGKLLDSAKVIFSKIENPSTTLIEDLYINLCEYYDYNYEMDSLIKNNEEFIRIYTRKKDKDFQKLFTSYSKLSSAYCEKGQHLNSLNRVVYKRQLILDSIFQFSKDNVLINKARLGQISNYRFQSINALNLSDGKTLRRAIEGFDKIIKYKSDIIEKDGVLVSAYANIGDACIQTGENEKAKRYIGYWEALIDDDDHFQNLLMIALKFRLLYEQSIDVEEVIKEAKNYYNNISDNNPYKEDFYYPMLYSYYMGKIENNTIGKAEFNSVIKQFLDKSDSQFENHQLIKAFAYDLLIANDFKNKNFTKTLDYLDKQLIIANKFVHKKLILNNKINNLKLAVINRNCKSIESIINTFLEENNIKNLNDIQVDNVSFTKNITGTLYTVDAAIKLSNVLLQDIQQKETTCEFSYAAAYKLAEYASSLVELNKSKLFYNEKQNKLISNISNNLLKLRSLEKQYNYSFNDKVLLNSIEQNVTSQLTIKNNINNIKLKYPRTVQTVFDNIQLTDLKIEELKINLRDSLTNTPEFQKNLDNLYLRKDDLYSKLSSLGYDKSVKDITGFNFKTIENQFSENEVVLRFYNFDDIYVFAISKDSIQFFNLGSYKQMSKDIGLYIKKIKSIVDFAAEQKIIKDKLEPVLNLAKNKQNIKIIPSGTLALLPFELFFESNNVIVNYNTSLQNLNFKNNRELDANLIAFSPVYSKSSETFSAYRDGMFNLPYAQEEANYITKLFNGDLYTSKEANKNEFVKNSSNYNIIHMAMHALVDETNELNSKLIFSDEDEANLSLSNIYNLNLNSDLVTLSACNTGYGKIDPIEGVLSLSRAFQYAGANTTLTSLWRVPDKETSIIMKFFYQNLKDGQTTGNALVNAKKQYLNTINDENLKHPYYWSGFVLTGNPETSFINSNSNVYYYILAGLLFLIALFFFKKRKSR